MTRLDSGGAKAVYRIHVLVCCKMLYTSFYIVITKAEFYIYDVVRFVIAMKMDSAT